MEWLRQRYKDILLQGLITLLIMLLLAWKAGMLDSSERRDDIIAGKADIIYVDKQNSLQDFKIELKADKSLVESMDAKLDIIISKLPN